MSDESVQVGFRWPAPVRAALEQAAKDDGRSMTSKAERILRAWLIEHGYMPKQEGC